MGQALSISEEIFKRWFEKMRNEHTIPKTLVKAIQIPHRQGELRDVEALSELLKQIGETNDDKD